MKKDLLTLFDLTIDDIESIYSLARVIKDRRKNGIPFRPLCGKVLAMIFRKPSTRTRVSFEAGMAYMGGTAMYLGVQDIQLGRGEKVEDTAKVLSRYVDAVVIRTFDHKELEVFAQSAEIPVINGLTDDYHPCQALSDFFTISELLGDLQRVKIAYVGDGNNVANSLCIAAKKLGATIYCASPPGYEVNEVLLHTLAEVENGKGDVFITSDVQEAVKDADVVYTDVWVSMGWEDQRDERMNIFKEYSIDGKLVSLASPSVLVMHCLPAHRGEEISADVIDGSHSIVFAQAENRLYIQNAILCMLMKGDSGWQKKG